MKTVSKTSFWQMNVVIILLTAIGSAYGQLDCSIEAFRLVDQNIAS